MRAYRPRLPDPIFLGFCAKRSARLPFPSAPATAHIGEVASVAACIAARPPAWIDRWDFNHAWCWNDAAAAWACIPASDQAAYVLYAYRAVPAVFDTTGVPYALQPHELFEDGPGGELPSQPDLTAYARLGYDIVQYGVVSNYGCSPLSCNGQAAHYPVNRSCLLDDLTTAVAAATAFGSGGGVEPGPYMIVEVWRSAGAGAARGEPDAAPA